MCHAGAASTRAQATSSYGAAISRRYATTSRTSGCSRIESLLITNGIFARESSSTS